MARWRLAIWVFVFFAGAFPAAADDWFVDNISGNDQLPGNVETQPLQTIQAALRKASPGDRIILKAGELPYREAVSITGMRNSGFRGRPLEIIGNGAVLDGSESIPASAWESMGGELFRVRPPQISFQRLYLDGRPLEKVHLTEGQLDRLQPLQWAQADGWIIVRTDPGRTPHQYDFACCRRAVGITFYDCHDVLISNLTIQGFQFDGISAPDRATSIEVSGCLLRGNGRSGANCAGAARLLLSNCLIGDNGESQIRSEGHCRLAIDSCDVLEQPGIISIDTLGGVIVRDGQPVNR